MAIPYVFVAPEKYEMMRAAVGEIWHNLDQVRRFLRYAFPSNTTEDLIGTLRFKGDASLTVNGLLIDIRKESETDVEGKPYTFYTATTAEYRWFQEALAKHEATGAPHYVRVSSERLKPGNQILVQHDPDLGLLAVGWRPSMMDTAGMEPNRSAKAEATFRTRVTKVHRPENPADEDDDAPSIDTEDGTLYLSSHTAVALFVPPVYPPT